MTTSLDADDQVYCSCQFVMPYASLPCQEPSCDFLVLSVCNAGGVYHACCSSDLSHHTSRHMNVRLTTHDCLTGHTCVSHRHMNVCTDHTDCLHRRYFWSGLYAWVFIKQRGYIGHAEPTSCIAMTGVMLSPLKIICWCTFGVWLWSVIRFWPLTCAAFMLLLLVLRTTLRCCWVLLVLLVLIERNWLQYVPTEQAITLVCIMVCKSS